jgi:hypothetical protein
MKRETMKERRERVLKELRELKNHGTDHESAHGKADDLLLHLINDAEIEEAFTAIEKWYA